MSLVYRAGIGSAGRRSSRVETKPTSGWRARISWISVDPHRPVPRTNANSALEGISVLPQLVGLDLRDGVDDLVVQPRAPRLVAVGEAERPHRAAPRPARRESREVGEPLQRGHRGVEEG